MVKDILKYYFKVAGRNKKYSVPPVLLAPIARIGADYIPPLLTSIIITKISSTNRPAIQSLIPLLILVFAVPITSELLWRFIRRLADRSDAYGMYEVAKDTFGILIRKPYDFHVNNFAGSLVAKTSRFVSAFEVLYDLFVYDIMGTAFGMVFAVIVLMRASAAVAYATIGALFIYAFVAYRLTSKRYSLNKIRAEHESVQTGNLADALSNAITVKTFAQEKYEEKVFSKVSRELVSKRLKSWDYQNVPMDLFTTSTLFTVRTAALVGAIVAVYHQGMNPGTVFLIVSYVGNLSLKFWDVSKIMRNIEGHVSNAVEMMTIIKDTTYSDGSLTNNTKLKIVNGKIEFKNVGFGYESDSKKHLFNSLNLSISPGSSVGLVGPSGSGKTTITKLLLRFMSLHSGTIEIDGQSIADVSRNSLRSSITYVPQEPLLFHRSLADNIAYGKPGATAKEIESAAKQANAHEFIEKLENGYETMVGERGIKLSGGQRQRIAIARAILKNSPVIVLDEATSALDSESEKLIQEALFRLIEGKTTIVVAHRLSTIKHLDRILVLENGEITEDGSHEELIKNTSGTYAKLWNHQSGGFIKD